MKIRKGTNTDNKYSVWSVDGTRHIGATSVVLLSCVQKHLQGRRQQ